MLKNPHVPNLASSSFSSSLLTVAKAMEILLLPRTSTTDEFSRYYSTISY